MDERTNKLIETYKTSGPLSTGAIGDVFASTPANAPITSASLQGATPINLGTPEAPTTTAVAASAGVESRLTQQKAALDKEEADYLASKKEEATGVRGLAEKYLGLNQEVFNEQQASLQTPEAKVIREAKVKAYEDLQTLRSQKMAELDQVDKMQNTVGNAKSIAINDINNRYAIKELQLSMTSDLADRKYTSFTDSINQIAQLKHEQYTPMINYYSALATNNDSIFNEAEKAVLTRKRDEFKALQTQAVEFEKTKGTAMMEAKEAGADNATIQAMARATNNEDLTIASGKFAGGLDALVKRDQLLTSQANRAKIYADINANGGNVKITRTDANGKPLASTPQDQALSIILGSGKFTKDQVKLVTNAINNGEDPFAVIKNQAKALMTGANQTKIESYETAQDALNNLETTLKSFYAAGGSTGIFKGNYEKVVNKVGEVNNPKLVELATQIQQNLQIYRNAVSGTAYSVQEGADIASIFPGINKSEGLNAAIITGRKKAFNDGIDGAYRGVLGSSYDGLKKSQTGNFYPTPTGQAVPQSSKADEDLLKQFGL